MFLIAMIKLAANIYYIYVCAWLSMTQAVIQRIYADLMTCDHKSQFGVPPVGKSSRDEGLLLGSVVIEREHTVFSALIHVRQMTFCNTSSY